ncbi:hypothetical protein C8J57DRAFT_1723930 [Mycena rebaudengoi]|nr:hypothetical protein C8J57DRAFT_1723930 [Mycena rebaudengoi]
MALKQTSTFTQILFHLMLALVLSLKPHSSTSLVLTPTKICVSFSATPQAHNPRAPAPSSFSVGGVCYVYHKHHFLGDAAFTTSDLERQCADPEIRDLGSAGAALQLLGSGLVHGVGWKCGY